MKIFFAILAGIFVVFITFLVFQKLTAPVAKINNHEFKLILAKTEGEKQVGLSKYKSLSEDSGMLFVFDKEGEYSFWMKDMKFPIDIIYIRNGKIVTIYENTKNPKSPSEDLIIYKPTESADKVLEINAELSKKYGFALGDSVEFKNIK